LGSEEQSKYFLSFFQSLSLNPDPRANSTKPVQRAKKNSRPLRGVAKMQTQREIVPPIFQGPALTCGFGG
jgi:hypothetical protein